VSSLEQPSVPTCSWKISSLRDQIGPTNQARFAILVTCCGGGACCELRRCVRRVGWTIRRGLVFRPTADSDSDLRNCVIISMTKRSGYRSPSLNTRLRPKRTCNVLFSRITFATHEASSWGRKGDHLTAVGVDDLWLERHVAKFRGESARGTKRTLANFPK
jgi:hypothetical protein